MNPNLQILIFSAAGLACAAGQVRQSDPPRSADGGPARVHRTWTVFLHPRSGYEVPIPPGVSAVGNPETANEPEFQSADRSFQMSAWGGTASDHPSRVMAAEWNAAQGKPNRRITYERRGKTWFVVSGTDVRGIEFYEKLTLRGQQVAFLNITFPRSRMRQYEPWVEQIEDGFRPVALRDGPAASAQPSSRGREGAVRERTPAEPKNDQPAAAPKKEARPTEPAAKKPRETEEAPADVKPLSAEKVAGKPGFVYSPFSPDQRLVDVRDVPSGTKVKCPYTMKIFRVP